MPLINVPTGGVARAVHVQQILNWLRGNPAYSEPFSFTGINSATAYALTVLNIDPAGKALLVRDSGNVVDLFGVRDSGVTVKPKTAGVSAFRVRNLLDTDNIFEVTDTGVNIGGVAPVTLTGTQVLTNKTLTAPVINSARVGDFIDETQQASAPAAPAAGNVRFYTRTADEIPRYIGAAGAVEKILVDTSSVQSLINKTLTAPQMSDAVITTFIETILQAGAPANPTAGRYRMYALSSDGSVRFLDSTGTAHTVATLGDTQTLIGKTITAPIISSPSMTDFVEYATQGSNPAAPAAGKIRVFVPSSDGILRWIDSTSAIHILTTLGDTQTLTGKTLTSPIVTALMLSDYIEATQIATPTAPGAGKARVYSKTGTDLIHYRTSTSGEKIVTDTDSVQTLTNKTLGSGTSLSGASLSNPIITNYMDLTEGAASPGDPGAGKIRFWAKTDNNLYVVMPGGSVAVINTSSNTPATGTSLARAISLGSL
jgi:hypothetical protein